MSVLINTVIIFDRAFLDICAVYADLPPFFVIITEKKKKYPSRKLKLNEKNPRLLDLVPYV